ncbi:MAG: class I SAM-dependent methyltransferase [Proteobacteria bacterium]|nr:class I SAM-dependent methyltransferase [Pseudomonadota bacterium]
MHISSDPSLWVTKCSKLLRPGSKVLDLACGSGRHARYLADRGHSVTAVDKDAESLAQCATFSGIHVIEFDLEIGVWPFLEDKFDGIIVTNYLHRPIMPHIVNGLSDLGVLIYETFMVGNERFGRPSNSEFLLRANELIDVVREKLQVVMYEAGPVSLPKPAYIQRICAVSRDYEFAEKRLPDD